ncbi:unnamed protein product [Closterium sp. NIES-54]
MLCLRVALTCPRTALLAAALPCPACVSPFPAHAPPCCPRRPAARRPAACAALLLPALLRAALLAAALPARRSAASAPPCPARAPPCWPPHRPALPARLLAGRHPALPFTLPCPGRTPLFPSRAPPRPALRASLVLARRPTYMRVLHHSPLSGAASGQVSASGPVAAPSSCRLLSHLTLLWSHCLGHPSLPRLRGMHSHLLVSGLPRSLPPLPPSLAPPCLPCVEGRQRAAPHSSSFPPTTAPLQTLHMDVGGEFSSDLLREFCRGEGIVHSFMLPASPKQNGVAECRIGLVMEVARTSMIHAAAPHFLLPFAVWYAAHQLNLWPRVSLPETSPTLRWMGKVGDASVFRVWSSRAFVRNTSADKLSSRAILYVFLGFPPDAPRWQFYHPTSLRVLPSQDVTFDESVPFYHLFPYRTAPLPPARLFLAPGPPMVDPLPPQGPAPSGVSQVDPLPLAEPVEGAESGGAEPEGAEPGGSESEDAESRGAESRGSASTGGTGAGGAGATSPGGVGVPAGAGGTGGGGAAGPRGARTRGTGTAGVGGVGGVGAGDPGARSTGVGGAGARGAGAGDPGAGGSPAGGSPAGGTGAGGAGDTSLGGAGVTSGVGGARAGGARAGGAGVGGAGAGGPRAGSAGAGGTGAGDPGAGGARAGDPGAGGAGAGGAGAGGTGAGGNVQRRPFFVPAPPSSLPQPDSVLRQVLSLPSSTGLTPSLLCPPFHQSQPQLQPNSPLPAPSPYAEQTGSLTERREHESCPASPVRAVRTGRRVPRPRPPPVPGTQIMALHPSSLPLRVPLPSHPASSLADGLDPESDLNRAASHIVPRLLATVFTDPSFESTAASALVAELVDFAAACRLDYTASLVAESESNCPLSVGGECALGTDVLEDRQEDFECLVAAVPHLVAMLLAPEGDLDAPTIPTPRFYAEAITGPYSSQWQTSMDAEMASWKSTGTYIDAFPPPG